MAHPDITLGHRIRIARTALGLSQHELAERVECSRPALSSWEGGRTEPRASDLGRLAGALGVDVNWLLDGVPEVVA